MTPKAKAFSLYFKFIRDVIGDDKKAKECALIAVDEIIELRNGYFDCTNPMQDESYWQEVKQEIEKL